MSNTITIEDIRNVNSISKLMEFWHCSQGSGSCTPPASREMIEGKIVEVCRFKLAYSSKERVREICEALVSLDCGSTSAGAGLICKALVQFSALSDDPQEIRDAMVMYTRPIENASSLSRGLVLSN